MNKRIPFVKDQHAESVTGQKLYYRIPGDVNAVTTTPTEHPMMLSQVEFYLERSNDPKLVEGMEPYPASRMRFFLRKGLREQATTAEANGGYDIKGESDCGLSSEDVYTRFRNALMKPEGKLILEPVKYNYFPFEEAGCNAVTVETEKPTEKSANGVSAQAS